jgi:hypothetical protein
MYFSDHPSVSVPLLSLGVQGRSRVMTGGNWSLQSTSSHSLLRNWTLQSPKDKQIAHKQTCHEIHRARKWEICFWCMSGLLNSVENMLLFLELSWRRPIYLLQEKEWLLKIWPPDTAFYHWSLGFWYLVLVVILQLCRVILRSRP